MAEAIAAGNGFSSDPIADWKRYEEHTEKALTLDPSDGLTRTQMGDVRALRGDLPGAKQEYERAYAVAPSDAEVLAMLSYTGLTTSDLDWAAAMGRQALRLNPSAPSYYFMYLGQAEYLRGAYREAITLLRKGPQDAAWPLFYRAMAHAQAGEPQEAQVLVQRRKTEFPSFTVDGYIRDWPVTNPPALAAIREGATKAGLLPAATR